MIAARAGRAAAARIASPPTSHQRCYQSCSAALRYQGRRSQRSWATTAWRQVGATTQGTVVCPAAASVGGATGRRAGLATGLAGFVPEAPLAGFAVAVALLAEVDWIAVPAPVPRAVEAAVAGFGAGACVGVTGCCGTAYGGGVALGAAAAWSAVPPTMVAGSLTKALGRKGGHVGGIAG